MAEVAIESPITGVVIEVAVSVGEQVSPGDLLVVIDSMKMENEILSEYAGTVKEINVSEDDSISENDPMLTIEVS